MLSKQQVSYIQSLHQKKYRQMYGKFLVEGDKLVRELLLSDIRIEAVFGVKGLGMQLRDKKIDYFEVTDAELNKISTHENPNQVIAVASIPLPRDSSQQFKLPEGLYLACDHLNDPGNAGTIIRTAEWFGVKQIFFSLNSVDIFNPKVVSAAKGSLFRIPCFYADLRKLFSQNRHIPVWGAFMSGRSIYKTVLPESAVLLIGNEANGIGEELFPLIGTKINIPSQGNAESLNAAVAAGIILSEFRRPKTG
jgi:TrmH family RNA methyltransferase